MTARKLHSPVIACYPPSAQPLADAEILAVRGGASGAELWRYDSPAGSMVLRRWPEVEGLSGHLESVHGWLRNLADLTFIPVPVPGRDGSTVLRVSNRCWELAPWRPGAPDLALPPDPGRVLTAFSALAKVHVRLASFISRGLSPGLIACVREIERLQTEGFDSLEAAIRINVSDKQSDAALRWLSLARAMAPRLLPGLRNAARLEVTLQPCLRDARPEHFLFEGEALTGLVDFGAMGIECVSGDLARLAGEWLGNEHDLRQRANEAYVRIRPLDATELALIDHFESAADLLIAGHWIKWYYIDGRCFDEPGAVGQGIERGLKRLVRLAGRLGGSGLSV